MLKYKGKSYKNEEVQEVNLIIKLGDFAYNHNSDNERYVSKQLYDIGISNLGIENPIDDLVYIYIQFSGDKFISSNKEDLELLSNLYKKIKKVFPAITISIHCDCLDEEWNEFDVDLEEFMNIWTIE
jgi:hypothetical protein